MLLVISTAAGALFGSVDLSFSMVWKVLKFKLLGIKDPSLQQSSIYISWELRLPRAFNLLSLGDETAISLGVNVKRIKKMTIIVVSFITGVIVAAGGIIGFVGFIIPHIVRFLIGSDHRKLFPIAFLTGGLFLLWMDILARTVLSPQEVPIGIFTSICGGPLFIWILYRKNKDGRRT